MDPTNKTSITFERVPSDYALLKITDLPADNSGGDTLWASGYELYDRLSPTVQGIVDGLKVVHYQVRNKYNSFLRSKHG
jgi:alpha-ketoglutarate-dependent taurine dioxygenase